MNSLLSIMFALAVVGTAWCSYDDSWGQEEEVSTYCQDNGQLFGVCADPDNCEGYIVCNNGLTVLMPCPAGTAFNSKLGLCLQKRYSDCYGDGSFPGAESWGKDDWDSDDKDSRENTYDPSWASYEKESTYCRDNGLLFGVYSDPDNCEGYIVCNSGVSVLMSCPEGTAFNSANGICVFKEYSDCYGTGELPSWKDEEWGNDNTDDRNWGSSEEESTYCKDNGLVFGKYANPDNCEGFIVCNGGFTVLMDCPENTAFNSAKEICVYKEYSDCYGNGELPSWIYGGWDDWGNDNDNTEDRNWGGDSWAKK